MIDKIYIEKGAKTKIVGGRRGGEDYPFQERNS
jgi:hypothetical protein